MAKVAYDKQLTALLVIDPTTISFPRAAKLDPLKGLLKRTSALGISVGHWSHDSRASATVCTVTENIALAGIKGMEFIRIR
jgi:hypothetical protein